MDIDRPREIRCMQVRNTAKKHENVRNGNYNAGENNSVDANTVFLKKCFYVFRSGFKGSSKAAAYSFASSTVVELYCQ